MKGPLTVPISPGLCELTMLVLVVVAVAASAGWASLASGLSQSVQRHEDTRSDY